jgi:hypothetical protein
LYCLPFHPEDGDYMSLRNIRLSPNSMGLNLFKTHTINNSDNKTLAITLSKPCYLTSQHVAACRMNQLVTEDIVLEFVSYKYLLQKK